ncbi:MAG: alpha/beta fold hydrolase [Anaerolineaceae bacterium]
MQVNLPSLRMEVEVRGKGRPAVLLHGVGLDHTIWHPMMDLFESQIQFIAPDLRGQGRTELGQADQSIEQMAEDVAALLDLLGLEKVILGGHSMGGYVALAFAEKHADRLAGLAMIATNAGKDAAEKQVQRRQDAESIMKFGSARLADSLSPKLSKDAEIQSVTHQMISGTSAQGLANAQIAIANRPERLQVLQDLGCPLLVVAGAEDMIIPLVASRAMADVNANAKLVVIPDVGHMPMMEAPDTLGALLLAL